MEFHRHLANSILILSKKVAECGSKPNKIGTTLGSVNDNDVIDRITGS